MSEFYVYVYEDPRPGMDWAAIYVGKGRGDRFRHHLRCRRHSNRIFAGKLAKIKDAGLTPRITVIPVVSESIALQIESGLIAIYGRINTGTGTLCNMTDGGDGVSGYIPTKEERDAQSKRMTGRVKTDEHRRNLSLALTGNRHSEQTLEKLRKIANERASSPSFREQLSEKLKGRKLQPEVAKANAAQLTALNKSAERRAQVSAQTTARHAAKRAATTHCKNGHEFTKENSMFVAGTYMARCRICERKRLSKYSKGGSKRSQMTDETLIKLKENEE